jgi:pectate lyase
VLASGAYSGRFEITAERRCRDGTASHPIQVFGEKGAVVHGAFRAGRAHWQFIGLEVTPGDSGLPALWLEASHLVLERLHLHTGRFHGVVVAGRARNIVVANSQIHDFKKMDARGRPVDAHGIVVYSGASDVRVVGNEIHHNSGDGIQVNGPGDGSEPESRFARNIEIAGNLFHEDVENAIDIKDARSVVIAENRIWSYAPAPEAVGSAIVVQYDASDVTIRANHVVDTRGVFVGRGKVGRTGKPAAGRPRNVLLIDNYLENSTPNGVGLTIIGAQCVMVYNNVFRNFAGGIAVRSGRGDTERIRIANNIFVDMSTLGFWLTADYTSFVDLFDYNAFASRHGDVRIQIGGTTANDPNDVLRLKDRPEGRMSHTVEAGEVDIADNDLARIRGLELLEAGARVQLEHPCAPEPLLLGDGPRPDLGVR